MIAADMQYRGVHLISSYPLEGSVLAFQGACEAVSRKSIAGRYTQQVAEDLSQKLESVFRCIVGSISGLKTLAQDGVVETDWQSSLSLLTELESKVNASFISAFGSLSRINPSLAVYAAHVLSSLKEESTQIVYVYYEGDEGLFIRGENAKVCLIDKMTKAFSKKGECALSWDRGCPMTLVADNLWQIQLIVKKGATPKYKFLISDSSYQTGFDYSIRNALFDFHMPSFDSEASTIVVPIDVGSKNKLAVFGVGTVFVRNQPIELSWDNGLDMECFGPGLWALTLSSVDPIPYKICLVEESGHVVFEEGEDRELFGGQEIVAAPKFPNSPCLLLPIETSAQALGIHLFTEQEEMVRKSLGEKAWMNRQRKGFKEDDILCVNPILWVDEAVFDGEIFYVGHTSTGRALIIQDAPGGGAAGISGMLILDSDKQPRAVDLKNGPAVSWYQVAQDIRNAGLDSVTTPASSFHRDLGKLRQQINDHGPAYVRIEADEKGVGYPIIVNAISEDLSQVEIRDASGCWEGTVKGSAFLLAWYRSLNHCESSDHIVQVRYRGIKSAL